MEADAIVDVELLSTAEGGRSGPTPATFLCCPFGIDDEYFDGRLSLWETGGLSPGARARVPVVFLSPALVIPKIRPGQGFTLWEGKTIGSGTFVEVLRKLDAG
jgi:hypothetical protein